MRICKLVEQNSVKNAVVKFSRIDQEGDGHDGPNDKFVGRKRLLDLEPFELVNRLNKKEPSSLKSIIRSQRISQDARKVSSKSSIMTKQS